MTEITKVCVVVVFAILMIFCLFETLAQLESKRKFAAYAFYFAAIANAVMIGLMVRA